MLRGYWLPIIAVGLITLSGSVQSQPINQHTDNGHAAEQRQHQPSSDLQRNDLVPIQHQIERVARALETANSKKPPRDDSGQRGANAEEWGSKWALGMLIVAGLETAITGLGVLLVFGTLRHTKRAADAARATVDAMESAKKQQLRAYVGVEAICLEAPNIDVAEFDVQQPPFPERFIFSDLVRMTVRNFGQTFASDVAVFIAYHTFVPFGSAPARGDKIDSKFTEELISDASRAIIDGQNAFTFTVPIKRSLEPFRKAIRKESTLLFDGKIEYTDIFGATWGKTI